MSTDTNADSEFDSNAGSESSHDSDAQLDHQHAQPVINFSLNFAGEAGNRIGALLLLYLWEAGIVKVANNPVGDIELEVPVSDIVNISAYFQDVDFDVTNEVKQIYGDSELWDYYDTKILTLIGGGGGREWRRVRNYYEEYPELDAHLKQAVTADPIPHFTLDVAGITGATGAARIRRHIELIRKGVLPSPADHDGVYFPLTVAPALRLFDQNVDALEPGLERRSFDNIFDHRPVLRDARDEGVISGDFFAGNALLSHLESIHQKKPPLHEFQDDIAAIRYEEDWSGIIDAVQYGKSFVDDVNNGTANNALVRSLLPVLYAGINPNALDFNEGDARFDFQNAAGVLTGYTWIPGHAHFDSFAEIGSAVPSVGRPSNTTEALYPASKYAAYSVGGGFHIQAAQQAFVLIHAAGHSLGGRGHSLVRRTLADELDINAADVATVEVNGLDGTYFPSDNDDGDAPELALTLFVGVDEVEDCYDVLGKQTL